MLYSESGDILHSRFDKVKKVFEEVQQDLEQLKMKFPLGEKGFINLLNQEEENDYKQRKVSLYGISEILEKLTQNNIKWEKKIETINCCKKFYRATIQGKKQIEIIRFEKQRFLQLKETASQCNLTMEDVLNEKEWGFLYAYIEWSSMKGRIWERLYQPEVMRIYLNGLSQDQGDAMGFYGEFVGKQIESYDLSKGDFENYFNAAWKNRKKNFYEEETDNLFRTKRGEKNKKYTSTSMDAPLTDNEDDGSFEDLVSSSGLSVENQVILRDTLCQTIIELTGNLIKLKKDKTLYMPLFYTECVVYIVKNIESGQVKMRHEKSIFEVMSLSFLDFFMKEICRNISMIKRTHLKAYDDIGFKDVEFRYHEIGFPFRQKDANVYKKYVAYDKNFHVSDASVDVVLSKSYKQFEEILHGLFDSQYKEEILAMFSERQSLVFNM